MSETEKLLKPFRVQVIADNSGKWAGNAMRYTTKEEAQDAARDLASRWTLVRRWRVMESGDFPGLEREVSDSTSTEWRV